MQPGSGLGDEALGIVEPARLLQRRERRLELGLGDVLACHSARS